MDIVPYDIVIPWGSTKMRSIRSTDCSVISEGRRPVQDNFQDHQSQLDVGDVCDLFSFTIYFTICSRTERSHFCQDCTGLFFCVLKMSNYTTAYIIKALSQLLPKYESCTWDAKTRKLLNYQIVISGEIQYFQTFFSEAYNLKEFRHFSMHA